jgi:hypothetical protein
VLSTGFAGKHWPETELNAALNMETSSGQVKVLPVLCGSEAERSRILERYPFVAPKLYAVYDEGLDKIVAAIRAWLDRESHHGRSSLPHALVRAIEMTAER